jgi:hypothetical protein
MSNHTFNMSVPTLTKIWGRDTVSFWGVVPSWELRLTMKDAETYRQYAADCRRLAATMQAKDRKTLLEMAAAWEARADEASRVHKQHGDREEPQTNLEDPA